jgi:triosephosphate isomerase
MRRYLIAGNWKMFKTISEALELANEIRAGLTTQPSDVDVLVAPPFTALTAVGEALSGSGIALGAQNMHFEREGAFTGEVSPVMLKDVGCSHVILGHSERRQHFGETDEGVGRKARTAFDHGLTPILCVGETLNEREASRTLEVVERQVERALRNLTPEEAARAVIAYEPVWAIGTGLAATPEQAQEVHAFIRRLVSRSHGEEVAATQRVLYGGSVKPNNAKELMSQADIDGALVGGACLKSESFLQIIRFDQA